MIGAMTSYRFAAASKATSGREQHYQQPRIDYFFLTLEALPSAASGL